ncbi:MAG: hypothetical protein ACXWKG_08635 [Limisphaerales bacterium]
MKIPLLSMRAARTCALEAKEFGGANAIKEHEADQTNHQGRTAETQKMKTQTSIKLVKESARDVLKAYGRLATANGKIMPSGGESFEAKGKLATEMSALYAHEISPILNVIQDMPLEAADVTDVNLGTLNGTLAAQRALELFRLNFPAFQSVYNDFSDEPGVFNQTTMTRVVIVPAVQEYDPTPDATGRPKGWSTITPAQTKDVPVTLDKHIGIPIVFDSNTLSSTMRNLFEEQAPAASYALSKYFVEKIYAVMTPANFNAYATINGVKVPVAYATFPKGLGDFARSSLSRISAIFNANEVPIIGRTVLLNSSYYEQLSQDPSLVTFFAGQQAPEIITANQLPKLSTFVPIEAPNLAANNATPGLAGVALHKSGVIAKSRLPSDYTTAMQGASYGMVTTVKDNDTKLSALCVQYVNHTGGYAEWRLQTMIGAAPGDKRGGLCITSQ